MRTQKIYIFIACGLVFLAIGFIVLRSDVPVEPIKVYTAVEPAEQSETQTDTTSDTSQAEHVHADEVVHTAPTDVERSPVSQPRIPQGVENIIVGGDIAAETPWLSKEEFEEKFKEELAEQRYNKAVIEYVKALQEHHKQFQAHRAERAALSQELKDIRKLRPKASTMSDAELDDVLNRLEKWREQKSDLQRREANWRKNRPISPTPPVGK